MSLNWSKWGRDYFQSLGRHIGTAGMTALTACALDGRIDWRKLGAAILIGGAIPSTFTFLQSTPVPEETTTVTTTETTKVVTTPATPPQV